ncbi:MAG: glycine cleavage T C-terminal barrel domain-containing protein, partial [Pseudomonadota bacterium]
VDADENTNPFELRLGRYVDLSLGDDVIGMRALRQIAADGPARHQLGLLLDGNEEDEDQSIRLSVEKNGRPIGHMTHKAWSYRLKRMIGYALVSVEAVAGDTVEVVERTTRRSGKLVSLPFSL